MRSLTMATVAIVFLWIGSVVAAPTEPEGTAILRVAMDHAKDPAALEKALAELDALVVRLPKQPEAHYARGWVLSRLRRVDDAVAAYDHAVVLDKKFADAAYNAGVVLATAGREREAAIRFDRALAAQPKHVDAAYNAGQTYYTLKEFATATARWKVAARLAPADFNTAKKLVQAYVAQGKDKEAMKARDKVFALKQVDPTLAKLKTYVFDQFTVGKHHIYVHEAFDTSGDLAYVYRFDVTLNERSLGSVNLETSAIIRELGTPFILGMNQGSKHTSFPDRTWKRRPTYKVVKAAAIKQIQASF